MRCTINALCFFSSSLAESSDQAEGVPEPLIGTASNPAGLSITITASSSYSTDSSREKRGRRRSSPVDPRWAEARSDGAVRLRPFRLSFFMGGVRDDQAIIKSFRRHRKQRESLPTTRLAGNV